MGFERVLALIICVLIVFVVYQLWDFRHDYDQGLIDLSYQKGTNSDVGIELPTGKTTDPSTGIEVECDPAGWYRIIFAVS